MTTFLTRCRACDRSIGLTRAQIRLVTCAGLTTWSYTCPRCKAGIVKDATDTELAAFASKLLIPRVIPLPEPDLLAGLPPTGPPIDDDDLIAFGLALEATPSAVR
jgi:hypothetical protein